VTFWSSDHEVLQIKSIILCGQQAAAMNARHQFVIRFVGL
jgi:hypothetical protein